MRILHIIARLDPEKGGVGEATRTIVKGLKQQNVDNEIVCLDIPNAEFLKKEDCLIHPLGPAENSWNYSKRLLPWLNQNLHRFDSVILHGLWLYQDFAVKKAVKKFNKENGKAKLKFFIVPHGMLDPYFQRAVSRKIKAIRNYIYWQFIEAQIIKQSDGILYTCKREMELAQQTFWPFKPKFQAVVGLGVDDPPCHSKAMDQAFYKLFPRLAGKKYYLFLSRIHEKKGVDLAIKAFKENVSLQQGNDQDAIMVIAGPGMDTFHGAYIKALVKELELEDRVIYAGMLTGLEKWGAFYNADVFVLPSHQENFGIAVVEAIACRLPVLISDQINIYKEIVESNAGIASSDNEAGTNSSFLRWQSMDNQMKKAMRISARNCFLQTFSVQKASAKFLTAIE